MGRRTRSWEMGREEKEKRDEGERRGEMRNE
jgi:hypothetical protein